MTIRKTTDDTSWLDEATVWSRADRNRGGRGIRTPHAQENTIAKIKARGKLLAGVKFDTPPFGYLGDKNEPVGFDIDLVRKVAEHIGVPVELVSVTSTTRVPTLVSGNVDLTAASMTHTRERDKTIDFSITYYTGGQSLLVAKSSTITGLRISTASRSRSSRGRSGKNIAAAAPKAKIVAFKDYNSAWLALAQGRVDALTGSLNILQGFANGNPDFKIVGDMFSVEPFGVGVREGDSALRDEINFTLQDLWASGEYTQLYRKWFQPTRRCRSRCGRNNNVTAALMSYHFDWQPIWERRDILISGFALTVTVSAAALILAVILGTLLGTLATAPLRPLRLCAGFVVECTRNVPLLIHMYFWYIGLAFLRLPPFLCAVFGLAIYSAAYVAEIVRGGIEAVARGQSQAALATGLTRGQTLRLIVYPQTLRIVAPSLAGLFSQLIKDSCSLRDYGS